MDEAIPQLGLLRHKDASVRLAAIRALEKLDASDAVIIASLARMLEDNDPSVREAAAQALGEISNRQLQSSAPGEEKRDNPALPRLVNMVLRERYVRVRLAAVHALVKIGEGAATFTKAHYTPPPTPFFMAGTEWNPDPLYHQLPYIQELIEGYVYPALVAAMKDQDPDVRRAAQTLSVDFPRHMVERIQQVNMREKLNAVEQGSADKVQFSAYSPPDVVRSVKYNLYVYAHLQSQFGEVEKDVLQFKAPLGGKIPKPKTGKESFQIMRGTPITVVPECDGIEFDPISLTKQWDGDWVRFNFAFTPTSQSGDDLCFVRVSIQTNGFEIAHIECSIKVVPQNPLAAAKLRCYQTGMYQTIFVSYAREDTEVVEVYRLVQIAVGNDIFIDTYDLPSGVDWKAYLASAIDKADVFQLFWSKYSAVSCNVHAEWEYALLYRCPETQGVGFIRPVYWEKPMPAVPPSELRHLNFRYVPLLRTS